MKCQKAFYLVDCLTALAVSLLGMTAVIRFSVQNQQSLFRSWESRVAREILTHAHGLPRAFLEENPDRFFDFRGQPVEEAGKFRLRIETETSANQTRYRCLVSWRDADDQPRSLRFDRIEEARDE